MRTDGHDGHDDVDHIDTRIGFSFCVREIGADRAFEQVVFVSSTTLWRKPACVHVCVSVRLTLDDQITALGISRETTKIV